MTDRSLLLLAPLCIVLLGASQCPGQTPLLAPAEPGEFDAVEAAMDKFFARAGTSRGTGFKQLERREWFVEPRLDPNDRLTNVAARSAAAYQAYVARQSGPSGGAWTFVNAVDYELGPVSGQGVPHLFTGGLGRVNTVAFHPTQQGTLFAGSATGGVWRSTRNGQDWTPMTDELPMLAVSGIAIDPGSPSVMYLLTGDGEGFILPSIGVLKSTDGGDTWSATGLTFGESSSVYGYKLAMLPSDPGVLLAATTSGLFRTADAGATWSQVQAGSFRDVEFQPGNPSVVYGSTETAVFRSNDAGQTWTPLTCGLPPPSSLPPAFSPLLVGYRVSLAVSPASPSSVYALYGGPSSNPGAFPGLFRSDNAGGCFTLQSTTPNILGASPNGFDTFAHPWYDLALAVSPANINEVHVGAVNNWVSADGGVTWKLSSYWLEGDNTVPAPYVHPDIHSLEYRGSDLFAAVDGGLYLSPDGGTTWNDLSEGLAITEIFRICGVPNSSLIYFGAQDNGSDRTSGTTAVQVFGGDGGQCQIDPANPNNVYISAQFGVVYLSGDAGTTFASVVAPQNPAPYITPFVLAPTILLPTRPNVLFGCFVDVWMLTVNFGIPSWTNLTNGGIGTTTCAAMAISPSNPAVMYVAKPTGVFRSTNGGLTWSLKSGIWPVQGPEITDVAVNPANPAQAVITLSGYSDGQKVYGTVDGGATWTNLSGSLPNLQVNSAVFDGTPANGIYVGMDVGVYYRNDHTSDWILFQRGLPNVMVMDLDIQPGTGEIRAGTYGRGLWKSPLFPADRGLPLNAGAGSTAAPGQ